MKYGDRVLLKEYKNGNKLWGTVTPCAKCNRTGKVIWEFANHVCFDCNGKGWYYSEEREYTPENLAKREAALAKKRAVWEAEQAELEAERKAEEERRKAERLAEIERNRGRFIGNAGDKIQMEVTLVRKFDYEAHFGWQTQYYTGYVWKTDDGNTLVWKTTGYLGYDVEVPWDSDDVSHKDYEEHKAYAFVTPVEGERMTIKGTIKDHQEYRNVNQTILTRVKWIRKEDK